MEPKKEEDGDPLSLEEAEAEMLKLLEFYFGNSNFAWDRFMQSKVTVQPVQCCCAIQWTSIITTDF